ncbi:ATP-binding protein [Alteribacter natronophilus]|uniref:ATP-binding protein n=1 Tax=Alteribacter natronophilus TaxID=2583810 RepID=UPI00110E37D6|nr:ATP-binding protein [Alteribacter natronophilus]TMW73833.1 GHKL domain-containing protein [Alteribacter natronophilus]
MDSHTLADNEEIMETIAEISSEWLLVFDQDETLVSVTLPSVYRSRVDAETFYHLFEPEEADRFQTYLYELSRGRENRTESFRVFYQGELRHIRCEGLPLSDGIMVKARELQEEPALNQTLRQLPIPYFVVDRDKRIRTYNTLFADLLKRIEEPLESSDGELSEGFPFHETVSKLHDIVDQNNRNATVVFEKDEIRLTVHGSLMNPGEMCVFIKDETVEHRFEQLLTYKQQMESVSQIAAGVAHELRNPLSVIKGFIQLSKLSNSLNKYYSTISSEIDRMNVIIEDFLSMSRKKIDKKKVNPSELMESMLMIFRSESLLHDIDFSFAIKDSRRYLFVNDQMIRQVMLNVLRNSIEAYEGWDGEKQFTMMTAAEETRYIITLEDYGPGMPPEVLEEIEKPFFTTKDKGTGIGIPLCKRIIEEHKGTFTVESKEGEGTKITISLPLYSRNEPMV